MKLPRSRERGDLVEDSNQLGAQTIWKGSYKEAATAATQGFSTGLSDLRFYLKCPIFKMLVGQIKYYYCP